MGEDCCCSGLVSEFQLQQISVGSFSNEMLAKNFNPELFMIALELPTIQRCPCGAWDFRSRPTLLLALLHSASLLLEPPAGTANFTQEVVQGVGGPQTLASGPQASCAVCLLLA